MNNKNILFPLFFFLGIHFSYAQEIVEAVSYLAKITYTSKSSFPPTGNIKTHLYVSDKNSQYIHHQEPKLLYTQEGYQLKLSHNQYISNYDFQSKIVEVNRILNDGTPLYFQWKNDLKWEITNEEKMIGNFKVRKAIADDYIGVPDSEIQKEKVYAWFTTDFPVPAGPGHYYGLPGVVLEVEYEKSRHGFEFET